jgi:hypothetical protein
MSHVIDDPLELGRDAHRRHAWNQAFDLFSDADARRPPVGDDLVRLAESAWFAGDPDAAITARAGDMTDGDVPKPDGGCAEIRITLPPSPAAT